MKKNWWLYLCFILFLVPAMAAGFCSDKPNLYIIATGGTIAGSGASAVETAYSSGKITVGELINAVPELRDLANIEGEQIVNIGSQDMEDAVMLALSKRVNELLRRNDIDGVVITHGTDTMEETAYFLSLTVHSDKPVILTGSMRPSTSLSADGPLNLYNAAVAALDTASAGKGVLVAMNGRIYDAKNVTKTNTTSPETFDSPNTGAVGTVMNGKAEYHQVPLYRHTVNSEFDISALDTLPRVGIAYGYANADPLAAEAFVKNGYDGIVYAGVGNGNIHKNVFPVLERAAANDIAVVRSSRTPTGETTPYAEVDDEKYGFVASRWLNPQKARILLQLALTRTSDPAELRRIFAEY